jgi:hypothetical protein
LIGLLKASAYHDCENQSAETPHFFELFHKNHSPMLFLCLFEASEINSQYSASLAVSVERFIPERPVFSGMNIPEPNFQFFALVFKP